MKIFNIFLVFSLYRPLLACSNVSPQVPIGKQIMLSKASDANEFLNFSAQYSSSSLEVQKQELMLANQGLAMNPADSFQQIKLVMIYGLPNSPFQDNQKAQNLLQNLLQENILTNSQLSFAQLMFDQVLANSQLNLKIKDEQKRNETLQQNNINLQLHLDAAKQKIEGLRNIEKLMGERELSTPK